MFKIEYALLTFFEKAKKVKGRKTLQKTIYLLQSYGVPFDLNYIYQYYGPYSAELQIEVDNLIKQRLLKETIKGDMYVYEITKKGKEFLKTYRKFIKPDFELPIDLLKELLAKNPQALEVASTYVYLLELGYSLEKAEKITRELKEHLMLFFEEAKNIILLIL